MGRISKRIRAIVPQRVTINTRQHALESFRAVGWIAEKHGQRLGREAETLPCIALVARQCPPRAGPASIEIRPLQDHAQGRKLLPRCSSLPRQVLGKWLRL